jgi:hypothetical protein
MESKFNRLFWSAWCSNFDLEKFNDDFFEYLLKEFGLFNTKTYKYNNNNDTIPAYSQSFMLEMVNLVFQQYLKVNGVLFL